MSTKMMAPKRISNSQGLLLVLIGLIMGLLVVVPILNRFMAVRMFLDLFLTAIAISMVYAVSSRKIHVIVGSLLAMVMLSFFWFEYFYQNKAVSGVGMVAGVLFYYNPKPIHVAEAQVSLWKGLIKLHKNCSIRGTPDPPIIFIIMPKKMPWPASISKPPWVGPMKWSF